MGENKFVTGIWAGVSSNDAISSPARNKRLLRRLVLVYISDFDQMEEVSTGEDDKIEEKHGGQHGLVSDLDEAGTSGSLFEDPSEAFSDEYEMYLAIAITEIDGEEIENEFNDALIEIEGMKSFPCSQCEKVCKSKRALPDIRTRNTKHARIRGEFRQ